MLIKGELKDKKVIVEKPKDVGRLYNKSRLGTPISGGALELNLIESCFLLDEEKIKIFFNEKEVDFEFLVKIASKEIDNFELKYLVFKDLRRRGHIVKISKDDYFDIYQYKKKEKEQEFFVCVFSERDYFEIKKIHDLLKNTSKGSVLWIAIVDDEGDITYYKVLHSDLKGCIKPNNFKKIKGFLLDDRVLVFDNVKIKKLFDKEFFGKKFGPALQLSFVEGLYLLEKGALLFDKDDKKVSKTKFLKYAKKRHSNISSELTVFKDLKKRKLVVKTGFKFGTDFRVYTDHPDDIHAEYLVHVVTKDYISLWSEFSRAVRLAHSVNKEIVFARILKEDIVEYICFGRLRP